MTPTTEDGPAAGPAPDSAQQRREQRPQREQPQPTSLRERKKAKTRAAIQSHALRLFRQQGYDATTIEQIISAADVSESTLFRYFPTKEALVLADEYDPRLVAAFQAQPADLPLVQALRASLREVFGTLNTQERAAQRERIELILTVPALRASMLAQFADTMQLLAAAIAARVSRKPDDFAARTVAGAIIGVMITVLSEMSQDPDADMADLIDRALAYLENGLTV